MFFRSNTSSRPHLRCDVWIPAAAIFWSATILGFLVLYWFVPARAEHAAQNVAVLLGCLGLWGLGLAGIIAEGLGLRRYLAAQARAADVLGKSETRFRLMFEKGPLGIIAVDSQGKIQEANEAIARLLGFSREELVGVAIQDLTHPDDFAREIQHLRRALEEKDSVHTFETRYRRKDGQWIQARLTHTIVHDREGRPEYGLGLVEDISEQKNVEDALRQSEQRYRLLAENVTDVIWTSDLELKWTYISPSFHRLTGFTAEEAVSRPIEEMVLPESAELAKRLLAEAFETAKTDPEVLGQPVSMEAQFRCKDGSTRWAEVKASLVLDETGRPTGVIGVTRDIAGRKAFEMELSRAKQLAEAASQAKSEFLANMSHEIRTPMTAILGYVDLVNEGCAGRCEFGQREISEYLQIISQNASSLLDIINNILDLSKIEAGKLEVEAVQCDPAEIARDVLELLKVRVQGKGLTLEIRREETCPARILSDPARLRQILINLVANAIKFTEAGSIRVVLGRHPRNADMLQIDVCDTGIGMSQEVVARLFEPFTQGDASMTRRYGGTGLGLTICKRLAKLLGGDISVRSKPGQGTVFSFTIPARRHDLLPIEEASAARNKRQGPKGGVESPKLSCRLLLAEDGPDNQHLLSLILKRAGAEVVVAENGEVAVALALDALRRGAPFDVILMDMQMPILDGYEATKRLREAGHQGPILALTAHVLAEDRKKCLAAGCDDHIGKPVKGDALIAAVNRFARSCEPGSA